MGRGCERNRSFVLSVQSGLGNRAFFWCFVLFRRLLTAPCCLHARARQIGALMYKERALEIVAMDDAVEPVLPRAGCPDGGLARAFRFE